MTAPRFHHVVHRLGLVTAVLASSLAGCTGGAGTILAPSAPPSASRAAGSIVVRIPATATSSAHRRASYVSPSSLSASVAIAHDPSCTGCSPPATIEAPLYGANACKIAGGVKTCTIALSLAPGAYAGTIAIYDGILDGQGHVTGKALSTNASVPMTIAPGSANAINVTLDGIPAMVSASILTPSSAVARVHAGNPQTTTYRLAGANATAQLALIAKDADGNVIVGPGAPAWSANASGAGFTAAVNGNTVTLTAPGVPSRQSATLSLSAVSPACSDPGASCALGAFVGFAESIAVADPAFSRVTVWTIGASSPSAIVTQGLSSPYNAVAFAADGTLFVANGGNNTVTAYAPPYNGAPTVISAGVKNPVALAVDASNDLIVANRSAHTVTVYPPPYTTASPTSLSGSAGPLGAAIDAGNHLWIVDTNGTLFRYSAPFTPGAADVAIGQTLSQTTTTFAMAVDAAGRPYLADAGNDQILRFDPPFSNQTPALTIGSSPQSLLHPSAIAVAADGTTFVANSPTVGAGMYSAAGAGLGITFGLYSAPLGPNVFAADADGTMWLATGTTAGPVGFPTPYKPSNFSPLSSSGFFSASAIAIYP